MAVPRSILSRELLPASIAIYTTVAVVAFEGLAVTAALPELAGDLGGVTLLPWVITAFLLASAVTTAVTGSFVDAHGTSTVFRWATVSFAASSLLAALSPAMGVLVLARIVQGAAGGAIISVGIAATALVYPDHLTGRALAANSNVWGILGFAGPAIAAAMLQIGSWRWIFLIMVPISVVALATGWRTLPKAVEPERLDVDWPGAGLLVLSVGMVLAAVSNISTDSIYFVVAGAAAGYVFWRRSTLRPAPLMEPRFLRAFPYGRLALTASLTMAAMMGPSAYLPVYVRGARGASASAAAWSVLWLTIGWTAAANIAGRVTDRVEERKVLVAGAILGPVALLAAWSAIYFEAPLPVIYATYFLMGSAVGTVTNSALQLVRRVVPDNLAGRATSAHAFTRTMGMSLGAGLAGGVILGVVSSQVSDIAGIKAALAGEATELAASAAVAVGRGFAVTHLVSLVLMVAAVGISWRFRHTVVASRTEATQPTSGAERLDGPP